MQIVPVNPFRCRVWHLHPRLDENITEESCRAEIESFEKNGQMVPALGRRLRTGADHDVELIYGARRLFVARHLNRPLLVELRDLSDRDAIVAMDMENRLRRDISAYERAMSYMRWLREGYFSSQHEIASALQVPPSQVSRLLRLAHLPAEVLAAFGSATDICEGWGVDLANLLKDPERKRKVIQAARRIAVASPRPASPEAYKQLCKAGGVDRRVRARSGERVVKDEDGAALFRVKHHRDSIVLVLPLEAVSATSLEIIQDSVARIMNSQVVDRPVVVPRATATLQASMHEL